MPSASLASTVSPGFVLAIGQLSCDGVATTVSVFCTRVTTSAGRAETHIAKPNVKEPAVRVTLALIKETFQISCEGKKIDESGD